MKGVGLPAGSGASVRSLDAHAYTIPTDRPESDGTLEWDRTTLVLVEANAADHCGIGYTYASTAAVSLILDELAPVVRGCDAMDIPRMHLAMVRRVRNLGRPGMCSMAIAAVDAALWDLKARLLDLPLVTLFGAARDSAPVYGSGGFTSYTVDELQAQLRGWVERGIPRVKMKVGRDANADVDRVRAAREAIGDDAELFVDANGAYSRKQALAQADRFGREGVSWFEEPVSSDDLDGLRLVRDRAPAGMEIAAGEYAYDLTYVRRMLDAGAVDVMQIDASRCGGLTGFLRAAAIMQARSMDVSAHCCPSLHAHVACAVPNLRHIEYFHDHARVEHMLFDGALEPKDGALWPDRSRPGIGLELKRRDLERYAA